MVLYIKNGTLDLPNIKEDPKGPLYHEGVVAKTDLDEGDMPELAKRFGFSYDIIHWDTPPEEVVHRYQKALQLAKEQTAFCDQTVEINTISETLEGLADDLAKTRTWYFMWVFSQQDSI